MKDSLEHDIRETLSEVYTLAAIIANCHEIINSIPDVEIQKIYAKESLIFISDYNKLVQEIKSKLELYFELERQEGNSVNFAFRRVYNEI